MYQYCSPSTFSRQILQETHKTNHHRPVDRTQLNCHCLSFERFSELFHQQRQQRSAERQHHQPDPITFSIILRPWHSLVIRATPKSAEPVHHQEFVPLQSEILRHLRQLEQPLYSGSISSARPGNFRSSIRPFTSPSRIS